MMRELLKILQNKLTNYTREHNQEIDRDMRIWLAGYCRALVYVIDDIKLKLEATTNDETKEQT